MWLIKLLQAIFLIEDRETRTFGISKNLTEHYTKECWNLYFDEVCVGGQYSLLKKEIERYKYQSDRHISTSFVDILAKCVEVSQYYESHQDWVIVPIPMHWTRYFPRGFDHIERLSIELSKKYGYTTLPLLRTKWTRRQAKLSRRERLKNKKNSFFLNNWYTVPSHLILIDDVVSSWSTLNEAAKVLKESWATIILCFTLASNA